MSPHSPLSTCCVPHAARLSTKDAFSNKRLQSWPRETNNHTGFLTPHCRLSRVYSVSVENDVRNSGCSAFSVCASGRCRAPKSTSCVQRFAAATSLTCRCPHYQTACDACSCHHHEQPGATFEGDFGGAQSALSLQILQIHAATSHSRHSTCIPNIRNVALPTPVFQHHHHKHSYDHLATPPCTSGYARCALNSAPCTTPHTC